MLVEKHDDNDADNGKDNKVDNVFTAFDVKDQKISGKQIVLQYSNAP